MKPHRRHQLHQKVTGKLQPGSEEISLESMIAELKKEVLAEVRLISSGVSNSAFKLVELDKELAELEREFENKEADTSA